MEMSDVIGRDAKKLGTRKKSARAYNVKGCSSALLGNGTQLSHI